jgi:hypothetical protein
MTPDDCAMLAKTMANAKPVYDPEHHASYTRFFWLMNQWVRDCKFLATLVPVVVKDQFLRDCGVP